MKWLKVIEFAGKCCFHGTVRSFLPGRVAEPQRDRHFTFGAGSAFFVPGQRRRKRRHAAACPSRRPSSWHCSTSSTWNDSLAITHQRISWISMNSIVLVVAFIFNFKYYLFILPRKFYNRCFSFFFFFCFSVFCFFICCSRPNCIHIIRWSSLSSMSFAFSLFALLHFCLVCMDKWIDINGILKKIVPLFQLHQNNSNLCARIVYCYWTKSI